MYEPQKAQFLAEITVEKEKADGTEKSTSQSWRELISKTIKIKY